MLIINLLAAWRDRSDNERPSAVKPSEGERVKRVCVCVGLRVKGAGAGVTEAARSAKDNVA